MSKKLLLKPRMSEKAYALSETSHTYVFEVNKSVNKHAVADAVKSQFEVTVTDVRITNIKGKAKRTVRKSGRVIKGSRSDIKKAYVTLMEGDSLPIFAAIEEAEEKERQAQERAAKRKK